MADDKKKNIPSGDPAESAPNAPPTAPNALWGGRFAQGPAEAMEQINASIDIDKRLYAQDIRASRAHCRMLAECSIISSKESAEILDGLDKVLQEIESGSFVFSTAHEDIHMNVEARLSEMIGDVAGKLHTARSRNDQVAADFRLWVRGAIDEIDAGLKAFQSALLDKAETHADTIMPGFTHLQTAQPVTFGHHLMAYVEMARRDRGRLSDCRKRLNENPLGAAALAGTSFPIDREMTTAELGFDAPTGNSLDAVSDRDFALEFLSTLSIAAIHLSRLADEIVLWSSSQFGFVRLSDAFSTGSSIMPQKRNPDGAELVRGKTGRIVGALNGLLMMMKGLPLAYFKDMQEDKEPVFDAADNFGLCLAVLTGIVADMEVNIAAMAAAAGNGFSTATDLADWLVREADVPFREAHGITARIVQLAEDKSCGIEDLSLEDMQGIEPRLGEGVFAVLGPAKSVESRTSFGGTSPMRVSEAIAKAREEL